MADDTTPPEPARRAAAAPSQRLDAVLFDMDGVVVDTAGLHATAWKRLLDPVLAAAAARTGKEVAPFDKMADYLRHVDGKPRLAGLRALLDARGVTLPEGEPADGPEADTLHGLAARKNAIFHDLLASSEIRRFPGTLRLLRDLRAAGLRLAIFSASRNAARVLDRAGVAGLFDARLDGAEAASLGLPGKPDPAMLLAATGRLGAAPGATAVIEDSQAGVAAAHGGGFAQAIGLDRGGNAEALAEAGAGIVAEDAGELALDAAGRLALRRIATLPEADAAAEAARLAGRRPMVFLDYDGTLSPIVPDPDKALLPGSMRDALATLARTCDVAVITGRDLAQIRRLVDLPGLIYAGSHGFEIAGPEGWGEGLERGTEFLPALDAAEAALRDRLAPIAGTLVERQRFSLAVHYRHAAADDAPRVAGIVREVLAETGSLRAGAGKMVLRIQPDIPWHKGHAVRWLLARAGDRVPVFVGDDVTDEDAFRELAGEGLTLVVRGETDRPTSADLALADTEAVRGFLLALAAALAS
ncbi:trehalose-phosphatase [Roseomonas sp. HF4]|uniref:trehalose-phosphatase n=1 Tax=Roseomonas sp. HF4 TaxID=2562313 RepID=UPI001485777E|nr:trehalose-phosphatase [Roseomonas sp. HF4]